MKVHELIAALQVMPIEYDVVVIDYDGDPCKITAVDINNRHSTVDLKIELIHYNVG